MKRYFLSLLILIISFVSVSCVTTPRPSRVNVSVDPRAKEKIFKKVAIFPFRAPVELAGSSVADMFTTSILKTYKYRVIERSQIETILKEQELELTGITEIPVSIKVGQMLGADGVILGTIPEYGYKAVDTRQLLAVGLSIRLIDSTTGTVIWSITHSGLGSQSLSLSQHAQNLVEQVIPALVEAWKKAGDVLAVALPIPRVTYCQGGLTRVKIEWLADDRSLIEEYIILRSDSPEGRYRLISEIRNRGKGELTYEDKNLAYSSIYYYKVHSVSCDGLVSLNTPPLKATTAALPPPVKGLTARSGKIRAVPLFWDISSDPYVAGYIIYRSETSEGKFEEIGKVKGRKTTEYIDKGGRRRRLKDHITYYYQVAAYNANKDAGLNSTMVSATTKAPPSPVSHLVAKTGKAREILLKWETVDEPEIKGYIIYRSNSEDEPFKKIAEVEGKEGDKFIDRSSFRHKLLDGTTYYYLIRSINIGGVLSSDSKIVSGTTKAVPQAPLGLEATLGEVKQITLTWNPNPEPDIAEYRIYRGNSSSGRFGEIGKSGVDRLTYTDKGLSDGKQYYYKIRAVDQDGLKGKLSSPVRGMTRPQPAP